MKWPILVLKSGSTDLIVINARRFPLTIVIGMTETPPPHLADRRLRRGGRVGAARLPDWGSGVNGGRDGHSDQHVLGGGRRSLGNRSLTAAGPLIQAERVPDAENEIRCTVIEPQSNVEIDLLRGRKAIRAAGIDKLSRPGIVRLVADVLRKKTCLLAHLLLDNEGGLSDELAYRIGGPEELRYHSSEVPTIA